MAQEDIERAFKNANDKLGYKGLSMEELKTASTEQRVLDSSLKKSSIGTDVFDEIEKDQSLNPQERQEVYQRLATACTQRELDKTSEGQKNTLMRNATMDTNFMSAYLKKYAEEYNNAVLNEVQAEVLKLKIPQDPGLVKRYPGVGENSTEAPEVRPETLQQLNDITLEMGNKIVQAQNRHLAKLSPEARKFLEASMKPTLEEGQDVTKVAMSSTLVLKNTSPLINILGREIAKDDQTKFHGKLLEQGNKLSQTFFNYTHLPPGSELDKRDKKQNRVAEKLLTKENLESTGESFDALSEGGQKLTNLTARLQNKIQEETLAPYQAKITQLETTLDRLKGIKGEPTGLEKFKAFFKGGFPPSVQKGLEKMADETIAQIDSTKTQAMHEAVPKMSEMLQKQQKGSIVDLKKEAAKWDPSLMDGVLNLPTMNQAFQKFAKENFSSENVNFHNDVEALKRQIRAGANEEEIRESAKAIGTKYVSETADEQINVGSGTRKAAMLQLEGVDQMSPEEIGKMFDNCDGVVVAMMRSDSLGKFQNTQHYKDGLDALTPKERQGIKEHGGKIQAEIGRLEKNVSVREKLGMQDKPKVQQQQKTGVAVK